MTDRPKPENRISLTVRYEAGHSYDEEWVLSDRYCVKCGNATVWWQDSWNHEGTAHLCAQCGYTWLMSYQRDGGADHEGGQRVDALLAWYVDKFMGKR